MVFPEFQGVAPSKCHDEKLNSLATINSKYAGAREAGRWFKDKAEKV